MYIQVLHTENGE